MKKEVFIILNSVINGITKIVVMKDSVEIT